MDSDKSTGYNKKELIEYIKKLLTIDNYINDKFNDNELKDINLNNKIFGYDPCDTSIPIFSTEYFKNVYNNLIDKNQYKLSQEIIKIISDLNENKQLKLANNLSVLANNLSVAFRKLTKKKIESISNL